tara:strand:- start:21818 stop:22144 length:327 start_codon:yes stop_codon:yes gene_type:complete
MNYADKECIPCKGGVPPMGKNEADKMMSHINSDWKLVGIHHIERIWTFVDFQKALQFTNSLGEICEQENHHADFELGWGRVKAMIWTHKINGLTESDFILAAKFDCLD